MDQGSLTEGRRPSTVDLLVITGLDQLLFYIEGINYLCCQTSDLNEDVNCTEPPPSVDQCVDKQILDKSVNGHGKNTLDYFTRE